MQSGTKTRSEERESSSSSGKSATDFGFFLATLINWVGLEFSIKMIWSWVDAAVKNSPPRHAFVLLHWAHHYRVPCSLRELVPQALAAGCKLQQFTFDDKRLIVRWLFADAELKRLCASVITSWVMAHGGTGPWSITP